MIRSLMPQSSSPLPRAMSERSDTSEQPSAPGWSSARQPSQPRQHVSTSAHHLGSPQEAFMKLRKPRNPMNPRKIQEALRKPSGSPHDTATYSPKQHSSSPEQQYQNYIFVQTPQKENLLAINLQSSISLKYIRNNKTKKIVFYN